MDHWGNEQPQIWKADKGRGARSGARVFRWTFWGLHRFGLKEQDDRMLKKDGYPNAARHYPFQTQNRCIRKWIVIGNRNAIGPNIFGSIYKWKWKCTRPSKPLDSVTNRESTMIGKASTAKSSHFLGNLRLDFHWFYFLNHNKNRVLKYSNFASFFHLLSIKENLFTHQLWV